jgi:hypothetical protein
MEQEIRTAFYKNLEEERTKQSFDITIFNVRIQNSIRDNTVQVERILRSYMQQYHNVIESERSYREFKTIKGFEIRQEAKKNYIKSKWKSSFCELLAIESDLEEAYFYLKVKSEYLNIPCPIVDYTLPFLHIRYDDE